MTQALRERLGSDATAILKDSNHTFQFQYQSTSTAEPDPDWTGPEPRTLEDRAADDILTGNFALWLRVPTSVFIRMFIEVGKNTGAWVPIFRYHYRGIRSRPSELQNTISIADLESAKNIFDTIAKLKRRGSLWLSIRTGISALAADWWEARYLFLWVAMESLFGPQDAREMTFRLCQRIALFLAPEGFDPDSFGT